MVDLRTHLHLFVPNRFNWGFVLRVAFEFPNTLTTAGYEANAICALLLQVLWAVKYFLGVCTEKYVGEMYL